MMKRLILILGCIMLTLSVWATYSQVGYVKTRGRLVDGEIIPGKRLGGVVLRIETNSMDWTQKTDSLGNFTLILDRPVFKFNVITKGQILSNPNLNRYKCDSDTLVIVCDEPETLQVDKLAMERRLRRSLQKQLQQREYELDDLKRENTISLEEYHKRLIRLYSEHENTEKLIPEAANCFSTVDYDLLNNTRKSLDDLLEKGEILRVDSLLFEKLGEKNILFNGLSRRPMPTLKPSQDIENISKAISVDSSPIPNASTSLHLYQSAKKEEDANNYKNALVLYLRADSAYIAEGLSKTGEYAQVLHSTGRAYLKTNNIQEGREYTRRALDLREKLFGKVSEKYIISLNNYALSFLMANELGNALKYQTEVIDLCSKMNPPHSDEGMYLINLARIYHAMNDDNNAVRYMEKALLKVEKFNANYEYALNFLSMVYMERSDNANAHRVLGLMEEHNQHELAKECNTPECHFERAEYYMSTGKLADAKDEFMAIFAIPLSDAQKAKIYQQYAKFLSSLSDYVQAGEYYVLAANASVLANGDNENATGLLRQAGLCYFIGKEYDKAIDSHTKVISNVDKKGYSESLKSSSLQGLGNAYSAKKNYPSAIAVFRQWIEHLKANGHEYDADYAKAYERLAVNKKFADDESCCADYQTAIRLYRKLGMRENEENLSSGLNAYYSHRFELCKLKFENDSAAYWLEKRAEVFSDSIDYQLKAGNFINEYLANYKLSLDYFNKALNLAKEKYGEDHEIVATCYSNIGRIYYSQGNYNPAKEKYNQAIAIINKLRGDHTQQLVECKILLGMVANSMRNYDLALKYYNTVLDNLNKNIKGVDIQDFANLYNNMGATYENIRDNSKALKYYERALKILLDNYGDIHPNIAYIYSNIASIVDRMGEYDKAINYYEKSVDILQKTKGSKHQDVGLMYNNMASTYYNNDDFEKAELYFNNSLDILKIFLPSDHPDVKAVLENLAVLKDTM